MESFEAKDMEFFPDSPEKATEDEKSPFDDVFSMKTDSSVAFSNNGSAFDQFGKEEEDADVSEDKTKELDPFKEFNP